MENNKTLTFCQQKAKKKQKTGGVCQTSHPNVNYPLNIPDCEECSIGVKYSTIHCTSPYKLWVQAPPTQNTPKTNNKLN